VTHNPLLLLLLDSSGRSSELVKALQKKDLALTVVRSEAEARRWLEGKQCQAMLLAVSSLQPHASFLLDLQETASSPAPVIVAASEPSVNDAVVALQAGAVDYLEAPVSENRLDAALDKAGVSRRLSPIAPPQEKTGKGCAAIIGNSSPMRQVFSLIKKVCDAETTVLIRGESGTGKELIAKAANDLGKNEAKEIKIIPKILIT